MVEATSATVDETTADHGGHRVLFYVYSNAGVCTRGFGLVPADLHMFQSYKVMP
jgi:hypothetical protein